MTPADRLNDYINSHPRECLFLLVISIGLIMQSVVVMLALLIFVLHVKVLHAKSWSLCLAGMGLLVNTFFIQHAYLDMTGFIKHGIVLNWKFWNLLYHQHAWDAF